MCLLGVKEIQIMPNHLLTCGKLNKQLRLKNRKSSLRKKSKDNRRRKNKRKGLKNREDKNNKNRPILPENLKLWQENKNFL
jgi:hypothetical protein